MGIVRNSLAYGLRFPLDGLPEAVYRSSSCRGRSRRTDVRRTKIVSETTAFIRERLEVLLLEGGLPFPSVEAALAAPAADVPALAARARAIAASAGLRVFEDAVIAYTRCAALAAKDAARARAVDPALFRMPPSVTWRPRARRRETRCWKRLRVFDLERRDRDRGRLAAVVDRYFDAVWSSMTTLRCAATGGLSSLPSPALSARSASSSRLPAAQVEAQEDDSRKD